MYLWLSEHCAPNSAVKTLGEAESADEEARLWVEKMRTVEKEREMAEKRVSCYSKSSQVMMHTRVDGVGGGRGILTNTCCYTCAHGIVCICVCHRLRFWRKWTKSLEFQIWLMPHSNRRRRRWVLEEILLPLGKREVVGRREWLGGEWLERDGDGGWGGGG